MTLALLTSAALLAGAGGIAAYRSGWLRTNRFLRQALEDAHAELGKCSASLAIEEVPR